MAAEEILDRAREHVMDAGPPVRGRRSLEEDERRIVLARGQRLGEELLLFPAGQ